MLFILMKNVRIYIMIVFTICTLLFSSSLATFNHRNHNKRDSSLLARALLDRVANYDSFYQEDPYSDDYEEENEDRENKRDGKLLDILESFRQHPRSLRIRPYENYDDYDKKENIEKDRLYKEAIAEIYSDITKKRRLRKKEVATDSDDIINNDKKEIIDAKQETSQTINKKKRENKDTINIHLNKNTVETKKEVINNNLNSLEHNKHILSVKKDTLSVKKTDNDQVASVKIDDTIDLQQDLVKKLDPKEIFLEANAGNTTDNKTKSPTTAHIKANPPPPKTTTTKHSHHGLDETSFIAIIAGCCVAGIAGIMLASFCWYKLRQENITKSEKSSPVTSIKKGDSPTGGVKAEDDKLVQSAEVFHYLHAKKQMQQMHEPPEKGEFINSDDDDEDDDEDTVYECPGLAPPGDMKVMNPLFSDAESHHSDKHSDSPSQGDSPQPPPTLESGDLKQTPPPS